ncbi:hypothetical protein SAY86_011344 [Trapa natans]|uniref:O-methyltransferase C-terminal domain-containing protein n=1 Tax=Trapa natans TaxID=22666 RepID=A0AAN7LK33_TRANT|nr:hypothetical protein SAY86_011344 [Trapa natans]
MPMFQYGATAPSFNNIFNRSMVVMLTIEMEEILMMYGGLEGLKSLVHVADCTSKCVSMVVSKYPSIKGIYFDQPHFVRHAPSYPMAEHVGGDMFASIPQNCYEALQAKDLIRASGPFGLDLQVWVQEFGSEIRIRADFRSDFELSVDQ